jgi:hypothetical protein
VSTIKLPSLVVEPGCPRIKCAGVRGYQLLLTMTNTHANGVAYIKYLRFGTRVYKGAFYTRFKVHT